MHLTGKNTRFVASLWSPRGQKRALRFVGKRHTVQLQETALVIEGEILRFSFPVLDMLFQRALCEWTTITIPYTRIKEFRFSRRWLFRGVMAAFLIILWSFVAYVAGTQEF